MKSTEGNGDQTTTTAGLRLINSRADEEINPKRELLDAVADLTEEDVLVADGFDEALIGYTDSWNRMERLTRAVYSRNQCIEILKKDMSHEEAEEYFEFNVAGAYMGPNTPIFVEMFDTEGGT